MTTTVTAQIQLRKGTAAAWTAANPTLASGEVGYETDTGKQKMGDGTTAWTALAYYYDPAVSGGVTDHGALTGLSDDDHSQYHTDARGDARYAPVAKGVTNGDSHDHSGGDGAQIAYSGLSGLPTLGTAAATASTDYAAASHAHGNLTNAGAIGSTANLPVITGASGVLAAGAFGTGATDFCVGNDSRLSDARTPTAHSHEGSAILSTGEEGGTKFLREDGDGTCSWQTPAGGDLVADTTPQLGGNLDLNGNSLIRDLTAATGDEVALNLTSTVNKATSGNYTLIKANATETLAPGTDDRLLDLQVGGVSRLRVSNGVSGQITCGALSTTGHLKAGENYCIGFYDAISVFYVLSAANTPLLAISARTSKTYGFRVHNDLPMGWSSFSGGYDTIPDLTIFRDAAETLAQRRGTNAQTYRLYNTYTDASNYERLTLKWDSNVCKITTEALGTGTLRGLNVGEAVTSLVGFYGVTPVVQQASADQAVVTLGNADSEISDLTFSADPTQAECQALRDKCEELADDVRALSTLVHSLRTALLNTGLIKGAA